eukprot:TRINITY_DN7975_c0_g1_i5.p1 TRINITY_DN7975_c0_g1~~TRINITY_DN7975_c0_g1_i5.p1  ORF type:complete len:422 (-),score=55.60 TRINITY_DN7975_c0_g1_i5:100-1365(-)
MNLKQIITATHPASIIVCSQSEPPTVSYANKHAQAEFLDDEGGLSSLLVNTLISSDSLKGDASCISVGTFISTDLQSDHTVLQCHRTVQGGETRHYDLRISKCLWDRHMCYCFAITDITERVVNHELRARDQYKSALLATVSHDLRSPLNGMVGMVQRALETLGSTHEYSELMITTVMEFLRNAICFSSFLLNLINDILDESQLRQGTMRINPVVINLRDVLENVQKILRFNMEAKGLKLIIKISSGVPKLIRTDPDRLTQVLLNLAENARKFTQKGHVKISVVTHHSEPALLTCSVEDTGVGIGADSINKLFKAFASLDDHRDMNKKGIGLGLSICQALVELLGPKQRIHVDSELGRGTLFQFAIYEDVVSRAKMELEADIQSLASLGCTSEMVGERENTPPLFLPETKSVSKLKSSFIQ